MSIQRSVHMNGTPSDPSTIQRPNLRKLRRHLLPCRACMLNMATDVSVVPPFTIWKCCYFPRMTINGLRGTLAALTTPINVTWSQFCIFLQPLLTIEIISCQWHFSALFAAFFEQNAALVNIKFIAKVVDTVAINCVTNSRNIILDCVGRKQITKIFILIRDFNAPLNICYYSRCS